MFNEIKGYRYSDTLFIWSSVESAEDYSNTSEARSALKARLKNPSSYEEVSAYAWGNILVREKDGKAYIQVEKCARIVYSATNGFGARIQDTYNWEEDGWVIQGDGFTYDELKNIVKMNKIEIIEKARSTK